MKQKFTLLALLAMAFFTGFGQQVPNGSFETWTNPINPDGWADVETIVGLPTNTLTFKDTTTFTEGLASLKLLADSVAGVTQGHVLGGLVSLGTATISQSGSPVFTGIAFAYRPDSLVFDYKYSSPGTDTAAVFLTLTKQFTDKVIKVGFALTAAANWVHMAIPLSTFYSDGNTPDTLQIQFSASNAQTSIIGSTLHVDAVRFGYVGAPAPGITATITPAGPTTFCTGDSVKLQADTGTSYTYQWQLGGTAITGATSSSYEAKLAGSYTVVIDSAAATATSQAVVVVDTNCTSGINNIALTNLSVYPNPATSLLNINSNESLSGFNLHIYDVVGRLVISQVLEGNNNLINVGKLANGTYIYRITDAESIAVAQNKFNVIK